MPRRKSPKKLESLCILCISSLLRYANIAFNIFPSNDTPSFYCNEDDNPFLWFHDNVLTKIYGTLVRMTQGKIHLDILKPFLNWKMNVIDLEPIKIKETEFEELLRFLIPKARNISKLNLPFQWKKDSNSCNQEIKETMDMNNVRILIFEMGIKLENLTHLNLTYFYFDNFLDVIGKTCHLLINIQMCSKLITDEDLKSLCMNIKDPSDKKLRCQNLQEIIINLEAKGITADAIKVLLNCLPKLSSIPEYRIVKVLIEIHLNDYLTTDKIYPLKQIEYFQNDGDISSSEIIIKTCPFLTDLTLHDLNDENLIKFGKLKHIKKIEISYTESDFQPYSFNGGIEPLLFAIGKSLGKLILMARIVDFGLIDKFCPLLNMLFCSCIEEITDSKMDKKFAFKNLEDLSICFNVSKELSANSRRIIFDNCFNLKKLYIHHISNFTYSVIKDILKQNPLAKLQSVILSHVDSFDPASIESLINEESLTDLYEIGLNYMNYTEQQIEHLTRIKKFIRKNNLDINIYEYLY